MYYIKLIHISCVIITITGFFVRGLWMINDSPMLARRWVRIAPHVVDTLLLVSAIVLAIGIQQYPGTHGWLTAKVIGLLVYIALGVVALRRGPTKPIRIGAWLAALAVFAYVVAVALTHRAGLGLV